MKKPIYAKPALYTVILIALAMLAAAETATEQSDIKQSTAANFENDNPFADFLSNQSTSTPKSADTIKPFVEKPELFLETVTLKFLDAQNIAAMMSSMSSTYGSVATDSRTNSLIICDTEENLRKILAEIRKADRLPRQLMIEAVIVDVQLNDSSEIGINWDILSDKNYDIGYRQKLGSRLNMVAPTADTIGDTTAYNTISLTGIDGGYFTLISGTIRNTIHLLQEKRNVEILASPRVMVLSGESASIETVTEIPYREVTDTSEGGSLASTQFKKVGVKLNVTAVLTDDDYILVTLEPEQSVDTGQFGTTAEIPIIDTRKAKTTLLLRDGEVVVMGGLRKQEISNQVGQIPLLGDLPVVGRLFRNTKEAVRNSELIVFMSPHIFKGEPLSEPYREKFDRLRDKPPLTMPGKKDMFLNLDEQVK
ncbi:MAG: secretin N-terminal domain-containing protein [Phycisphaerae bacterium]